jgi:hypothetical protein
MPPARLQELLTSERTCNDPHRIRLHAGVPTTIPLGAPIAQCRYEIHKDGVVVPVSLDHAEGAFEVVAQLTTDGRTQLHFTPEIKSGRPGQFYGPAPDRSGWVVQEQRPKEEYSALGWQVTLDLNEYVVVGARFDRPNTLGHCLFIRGDEPAPKQQLLVIRTSRPVPGLVCEDDPSRGEPDLQSYRAPPLALRAAWAAACGSSK